MEQLVFLQLRTKSLPSTVRNVLCVLLNLHSSPIQWVCFFPHLTGEQTERLHDLLKVPQPVGAQVESKCRP